MPELSAHLQSSLHRTGKDYRAVHEWIDDPTTKNERHDFSKVLHHAKIFAAQYGEEAAQEYVMRLVEDLPCRFHKTLAEHEKMTADCLKYFGAQGLATCASTAAKE